MSASKPSLCSEFAAKRSDLWQVQIPALPGSSIRRMPVSIRVPWLAAAFVVLVSWTPPVLADGDERYPLDDLPRVIEPRGKVRCPNVPKKKYRGDVVRFRRPVYIYEGFEARLRRFEELVRDTAVEVYGRAPRRIRHLGTYNCRRIRRWPTFLSEHGLANAIDIEGFDFGRVRGRRAKDVPRRLRRAFEVRVEDHWNADRGPGAEHSRFLRLLAQRVIDERLFRVILGPAEAGHHNHFHFDMSPWNIVNVFE